MGNQEFWKNWQKKTKLETAAIKSLRAAKKIILKEIPKYDIISIYVKGSLIRRELDKDSDVDIILILKKSKHLNKLNKLHEKYKDKYKPKIEIKGYSFWELKTGKRVKNKSSSTPPYLMTKHLENFKLIFGKDLSKNKLFKRTDKEDLKGLILVHKTVFLVRYKKNKMSFRDIVKQTFWLAEMEQKISGEKLPHNWKKLEKSIKNEKHIIHEALKYRLKPTKDKKIRAEYIRKLKKYLKKLEKLV